MQTKQKEVILFSDAYKAYNGEPGLLREYLGSKGAGLAEMTYAGLPVPPGFTITTKVCSRYEKNNYKLSDDLIDDVINNLKEIEKTFSKKFGDKENPLLLSVRSGAKHSMPGMMDTILNIGLNDETINGLVRSTKDERFAYDSYRRLIQMFGNIVLGISKEEFELILSSFKTQTHAKNDSELSYESLKEIVKEFKKLILEKTKKEFPQDLKSQLSLSIEAVFKSWNNPRAKYYRKLNKIPEDIGTAVNIQAMVFGNMGNDSATGVAFTRNPSTGENEVFGEYLINAQGEDVVSGVRTPQKLASLKNELPEVYKQLLDCVRKLEIHYKDAQDIEFTIEKNKLWFLQTRTAKRTAGAAVKIAFDLVKEKIITKEEALLRIEPEKLNYFLLRHFDESAKKQAQSLGKLLATGLNASPGAATGKIIFNPNESERLGLAGQKVILVRIETCPDDIHGIVPAAGILTTRGGMTSHAAVVARGMGKPCVAGCEAIKVDLENEHLTCSGVTLKKGDIISIDGSTGEVFIGEIDTKEPKISRELESLLSWADEIRKLGIRANADTPQDAKKALELGACGIGLCRTEHMFMEDTRLPWMQKVITANTERERNEALKKLEVFQKQDFKNIFKVMKGLPVTIRLLDPPLHEFLPKQEELKEKIISLKAKNKSTHEEEGLLSAVKRLSEANPMMGLRGCRLGIVYPEINKMQTRAIFEAACEVETENIKVNLEIMIPLISEPNEIKEVKKELEMTAIDITNKYKKEINYKFGTMIEVPRAAMLAAEIAEHVEFFSFGTNDLTQMTFAFSRDDAEGKFLHKYLEKNILYENPFEVLDTKGVGRLMEIAVKEGKLKKPDLKIGICGEHGGEPKSIGFAHKLGLDYVSCSPFRIPIARLAAAQAELRSLLV